MASGWPPSPKFVPSAQVRARIQSSVVGSWESAGIRVEPSGNVVVMTGASPHGQGQETAFAQLVADAFGIDIDAITVLHGDTDLVTHGVGTMGSRGLVVGGSAVRMAIDKISAKATRIAAHLLDTTADQVDLIAGQFTVRGAERSLELSRRRARRPRLERSNPG